MTPQQEHICLQNFKTSMIASGHGDRIDYNHEVGFFIDTSTHVRWLGYKRCWEEEVLKEGAPTQGTSTVATDFTPPDPNTEEFVFVGGPLHGLHHMDPNIPWLVTEHNSVQYLYIKVQPRWGEYSIDSLPSVFLLQLIHTLR